jgi:peptidoglycan/LPS O-acetylase OafA/YrhL
LPPSRFHRSPFTAYRLPLTAHHRASLTPDPRPPDLPLSALGEGTGRHLDQLDTLRAFAVLGVLIRHFWPALQPGLDLGARGVHLFFALSGFLITGILLRSRDQVDQAGRGTGLAVRRFYIRRFLRIFPVYYLVLAVTWALAFPDVRSSLPWHLAYGSNVLFAIQGQWPATTSHLWSLSVEEQFYLIWPPLMFLVPRRHIRPVVAGFILAGPFFRVVGYFAGLNWVALQTLLPASFDSLGMGAWLAWIHASPAEAIPGERKQLDKAALLALPVALVIWLHGATGWWPATAWLWLGVENTAWAVLGAWVIDRAARGVEGPVGWVLSLRPLIYLGRISYGVYLIHLFVPDLLYRLTSAANLPYPTQNPAIFLVFTAISVALAAISWHYYEAPINRLKRRFPYA